MKKLAETTTSRFSGTGTESTASPPCRTLEYYVDAGESGKFLGIHRRTVLQMARDGIIPAHPLGDGQRKAWRFLLSELDEWMRGRLNSAGRPCSPIRRNVP
jgi:excisionase family DNA binding protein